MTNEQIGLLLIGIGVIINFGKQFYELFFQPKEDISKSMSDQELDFMKQLHAIQLENNEYQKQILEQLGKLNGILSVQDSKMISLDQIAKDHREDIKGLYGRINSVESRLNEK